MTYRFSLGLQSAVYAVLSTDPGLADLVGGEIYDAPLPIDSPAGTLSDYVVLGEETARPNDTKTSVGAIHDIEVSVFSAEDGFSQSKRIAAAICDALIDAELPLTDSRLIALRFLSARATRATGPAKRRIVLRFRAVVEQD